MEKPDLHELEYILDKLVSISYDQSVFYQRIYTELGDRVFLEKLLRLVFERPGDLRRVLSRHISILNSYGTFLAKAYSIALLVEGLGRDVLNPIMLLNELYRPHNLISLYNPLVLTYLYVNHRDIYEQHVLKSLSDQLVMYEFNPVHSTVHIYRDHLFHVSLKYEIFVSSLYSKYGLSSNVLFKNILQDLPLPVIASSFRNYIRIVSSLLELLRAIVYAYTRSMESMDAYRGLSDNLVMRIRAIHDNYRYSILTNTGKIFNILNAMLDLEGRVFRDSLVKLLEILLSESSIFKLTCYDILVFTYESHRFREFESRVKEIQYSYATNLSIMLDKMVSLVSNAIINRGYLDVLKEVLSRNEEPYSTLRKKLHAMGGVLPKWLEELRSR